MKLLSTESFPVGIGRLSRATGCSPETIRYYEQQGLLSVAGRTAGGHRIYRQQHYKMLMFILRAKHLGFGQTDVRRLVDMADPSRTDCGNVRQLADHQLKETRSKIRKLQQLEKTLNDLIANCESGNIPAECPMIDSLLDEI